jgi:hypothetical protein
MKVWHRATLVLKKIYDDPVWSKVIAATILAAAGAAWLAHRNWPGWVTGTLAPVEILVSVLVCTVAQIGPILHSSCAVEEETRD